jgi:hypothetical protein
LVNLVYNRTLPKHTYHCILELPTNLASLRYGCSGYLFYDYDRVISDRIIKRTVSSLSPIYTGLVSDHEAGVMSKLAANFYIILR